MIRLFALLLVGLLCAGNARADRYTFLGAYASHTVEGSRLTITAANNVLRLTLVDSATVRVQLGRDGTLLDRPSFAVTAPRPSTLAWRIEDEPAALRCILPRGVIIVQKHPVRLQFADTDGTIVAADDPAFGHAWDGKEVQVWRTLHGDERFYGLGEKVGDVNKRGGHWTMWNSDFPAYTHDRDPLYASVPFFIGMHGGRAYGTFLDNSYRSVFNMGAASDRVYSFGAEDGELNYYFMFGPRIADVVRRYADLTGRMPLPPMWALGYQQCRWAYFPDHEVRDIARNFRERGIPADVLYLDIRYMDNYKVFTWDSVAFPDPPRLLADLEALGFKVVPIIDPGIKVEAGYDVYEEGLRGRYFATYPDGTPYAGEVWPGWCHFPDFTRPDVRTWWGDKYGALMDIGIDGFWNDMNEPAVWGREFPTLVEFDDGGLRGTIKKIHNVYGHLEAQASYEGMRRAQPDKRPFILTRAAFAGTQRWAALWTGDNSARFDNLRMGLRMSIGLGLSGMPFTGPDIGGFNGEPSAELFVRWMQAAVFTPFMRTHTTINTRDQEPWSFGEWTESVVRDYISMRYQYLPYLYTEFRNAARSGLPVMRPLFLDHEDDAETFNTRWQHQFLVGTQILVAPVVDEGRQFQDVYLPRGRWLDAWTGDYYEGGRRVIVDAPLERLPLFYRVGALIPRRETQQFTGEQPLTELILDVVPGDSASYTLYLDAGDGFAHEHGGYDEITFRMHADDNAWVIETSSSNGPWAGALRRIRFRLHGAALLPRMVEVNGHTMVPASADNHDLPRPELTPGRKRAAITLPFTTGVQRYRFEY
ncbi:MAG: glycoside hydrolase family 31 protein [Bacteroidota bacterium]|jgi:alpha-glucosidase|nr:glycoside hydrolase family 31 protein [Bacteroidota bacterium]